MHLCNTNARRAYVHSTQAKQARLQTAIRLTGDGLTDEEIGEVLGITAGQLRRTCGTRLARRAAAEAAVAAPVGTFPLDPTVRLHRRGLATAGRRRASGRSG